MNRPYLDTGQELTDEQRAALHENVRLIEAGPGAGKTRTVVARLRQHSIRGTRVALLSFTNAAVDAARRRCHDHPGLLDPPNFIGTFDQFFHRYIVTPEIRATHHQSPTYVSSWDDLPDYLSVVRPTTGGTGIRLSKFIRAGDRWTVDESRLSRSDRIAWEQLTEWTRNSLSSTATSRIQGLLNAFVLDATEARLRALRILEKEDQQIVNRLSLRFAEIIVDEFQDCDQLEHQLLERLGAKVPVVVVADPDQAIYEFRQSTSDLYPAFRDGLKDTEKASLTICFRSTPAICKVVSALRSVGEMPVTPSPEHAGGAEDIYVVVGTGTSAGKAALAVARRLGIPGSQTRILAHRRSDSRALARSGVEPPKGASHMEAVLAPLADLVSGTADTRVRLAATQRVEAFILNQLHWESLDQGRPRSRDQQLAALEVSSAHVRLVMSRLVRAAPAWVTRQQASAGVRSILEEFSEALPIRVHGQLGRRLVVPPKVWSFWQSRTTQELALPTPDQVRWTHVHAVKGQEYDAVIFGLPRQAPPGGSYVLDDWEAGLNTEARRVLYVGASRARRLLVLVVPRGRAPQLRRLLDASGAPSQFIDA